MAEDKLLRIWYMLTPQNPIRYVLVGSIQEAEGAALAIYAMYLPAEYPNIKLGLQEFDGEQWQIHANDASLKGEAIALHPLSTDAASIVGIVRACVIDMLTAAEEDEPQPYMGPDLSKD